ncbi:MAG TPA: type II toxin-antitoxin system VapC family toxin [Lichenihabitans sp.]|jgi:hypothetical protein|nr:type II toxin-antitoxin system VapC family toxin [Lichenihabitans sp.]
MFLLDTNVLFAMMAARPAVEISTWVAAQAPDVLFTTTVCQAEILAGLAIMPAGRRKADLEAAARAVFTEDFDGRVWTFDAAAASAHAAILATRRRSGRPIATIDLMIGAIARSRGAAVVTRNVPDFDGYGLTIVNPWDVA